ncbi:TraB/GumN family protein [Devosia sp. Leaf420]|uniref:TraB/GumN family protein n=1 Tax=Devosia sp. Leaf420 TaxID=1736374 RepID=UPI000782363D|nr:TraB/GumN family protein [Devosia sp. Leaf420]
MTLLRPFALLVSLCGLSSPALAAPAIWKVSDADSSVWLFGSIHLLPPDTDWRTEEFDKLVDAADRVYFETDLGPAAQAEIIVLTAQRGFSTDAKLLSEKIDSKLMGKVRSMADAVNVPVASLLAMEPWMAATMLSTAVMTEAGYDPTVGVDSVMSREIPIERQGFLETAVEQMDAISGGTRDEHIQLLTATMTEGLDAVSTIDAMKDAWVDGTPELVGDIFLAQLGSYGDGFTKRLITDRNTNWTGQISDMLARNEHAFLIVGTGHLVGEDSVITMLENAGFSSERVQ